MNVLGNQRIRGSTNECNRIIDWCSDSYFAKIQSIIIKNKMIGFVVADESCKSLCTIVKRKNHFCFMIHNGLCRLKGHGIGRFILFKNGICLFWIAGFILNVTKLLILITNNRSEER